LAANSAWHRVQIVAVCMAVRRTIGTGEAPRRLPTPYRTKKRFGRSDERKAFIVKSLMRFYAPRNGEGRKGDRRRIQSGKAAARK
jgi:hypothetical protein